VAIKNKSEKLRFGLVGIANTLIDFTILFTLTTLGLPTLIANIASTSTAFCFSFFANKKYTFKTTDGNTERELFLFVIITLFGLWVLQSIVIKIVTLSLSGTALPAPVILAFAKFLAIIVSLTWNYTLYSRVVFKRKD
jgi:putative flippase GtrA